MHIGPDVSNAGFVKMNSYCNDYPGYAITAIKRIVSTLLSLPKEEYF